MTLQNGKLNAMTDETPPPRRPMLREVMDDARPFDGPPEPPPPSEEDRRDDADGMPGPEGDGGESGAASSASPPASATVLDLEKHRRARKERASAKAKSPKPDPEVWDRLNARIREVSDRYALAIMGGRAVILREDIELTA
ncbi:hypothetical protein [Elstera litoralis]|nr:hypothetical protein [Elstera litoralis]